MTVTFGLQVGSPGDSSMLFYQRALPEGCACTCMPGDKGWLAQYHVHVNGAFLMLGVEISRTILNSSMIQHSLGEVELGTVPLRFTPLQVITCWQSQFSLEPEPVLSRD